MKINVCTKYAKDPDYDYVSYIERINLDAERIRDLSIGEGFVIKSEKAMKDDIKNEDGIYSTKYGPGLEDVNAFGNRYRCKCGYTTMRFYHGLECPICHTPVEFQDDDFKMFGWVCLKDPYHIIHPNLYTILSFFIGAEHFKNIITPINKKDEDGHEIDIERPDDEPFYGIGMLDLYDRFDEIMTYYKALRPNKKAHYDSIMEDREKVFTQSIPVYTINLRPFLLNGNVMSFEGTNAIYNIIAKIAAHINDDSMLMNRKKKPKNQLLFDLQSNYMKLYNEIIGIISGKKGSVQQLFGGRYNFTARSVIVPDPYKRIDEVALSYQALCGLLQQRIINILRKTYSMRYNDAYKMLNESLSSPNKIISQIIEGIIHSYDRGLPVLINRNPTISIGGILQMYCTEIGNGFTMSLPLEVLSGLAADFDGDTLNIMLIINQEFQARCEYVFNPRNSMYISKNDGMFNNSYNHKRDTIINMNTFVHLSRDNYSQKDIDYIKSLQDKAAAW